MGESDLLKAISRAIYEPDSIATRRDLAGEIPVESLVTWQARAVMHVIGPWLASDPKPKHDPSVNCTCEPGGEQCEYALLSDAVIRLLNPPDEDSAQVAICISAVERIAAYVTGLPCECTPEMIAGWDQCERCAVLGQSGGKPVER